MSKATKKIEITISGGRILGGEVQKNGTCTLTVEVVQNEAVVENPQDAFVLVEASQLSLNDEFMKYEPPTEGEKRLKQYLTEAIKKGLKDFWRPKYDPSFNEEGNGICYVKGKRPAVGKSHIWWKKVAKAYCPERHSRLGTKSEYVAFMGILIQKLVESGWKIADAWRAVCYDSKELGHYWESKNAKHAFEKTGSREICGFFDLANTCKILAEDEEAGGFWVAGGYYDGYGDNYPLADLYYDDYVVICYYYSVGWIVLD